MITGNIVCRMLMLFAPRRKAGILGALQAIGGWVSGVILAFLFWVCMCLLSMLVLSAPPPLPKLMSETPAIIISLLVSTATTVYLFIYCLRVKKKYEALFSYSVSDESIAASVPGLKLTYSRKENTVLIEKDSEDPIRVCRYRFTVEKGESVHDRFVSFPGTAVVTGPVVTVLTQPTSGYVQETVGYEICVRAQLGPITDGGGNVAKNDMRELTTPAEYGKDSFFDRLYVKWPGLREMFSDVLLRFNAETEPLCTDWLKSHKLSHYPRCYRPRY